MVYKNFKSNRGAPSKDTRLVLEVIIIKHIMKADDRGVIEMIQENPYMQYFLGLETFTYEQVMTPSLLVSIKKRIDLDVFESLTDDLIRKGLKLKPGSKPDDAGMEVKDEDDDGGRQWITLLGHKKEDYSDPLFISHIVGGLKWVLTKKKNK